MEEVRKINEILYFVVNISQNAYKNESVKNVLTYFL